MMNKLKKANLVMIISILIGVPLVLYVSVKSYGEKNYLIPSFLILILSFIPFIMIFEKKKIRTREIVLISAMSAIAVLGRVLFFFAPEIKATSAIVIISGMTLGGQAGFFIGAISAFVSNFFFGQGSWTMWQMFAFGMIGVLSGVILKKKHNRIFVCLIGFLLVMIVYGGIVNFHSLVMFTSGITWDNIKSIYLLSIPFDFVHALSTTVFLWFLNKPFLEKISRIKEKYGMIELE
ncbi:ECF transporter S component [uncultured Anaerofustis sp.]|uniref:ECF transporter S component n=1 Tax=uncultured Anaerofustis sp. TaxID=904996 RepID=UPI0025E8B9E7|nr:ECF transporter S component [uncultured Anaerofustis sp.]